MLLNADVLLSPKSQCHLFTVPCEEVDWSVNTLAKLMQTGVTVKLATGFAHTVIVFDVESTQLLSERTINFVEYVPSVPNTCANVSKLLKLLPLYCFHVHDAMCVGLIVEVFTNFTPTPTQVLLVVKLGVGFGLTTMVLVIVSKQP